MDKDNFEMLCRDEKRDLLQDVLDKRHGESDMDWSEICDKYSLDIAPDTLRKAAVGLRLAEDAGLLVDPNNVTDQTETNAIDNIIDAGYVERVKLRDLRNQINNLQRQEARSQMLRETIAESIRHLPKLTKKDTPVEKNIVMFYPSGKEDDPERELVVCIGDIHFGAEFTIRGLHGEVVNRFDKDVCAERLHELLCEICKIAVSTRVDVVHLCFVGDLIDGMLRQSQLTKLQYGVVDSTMMIAEMLANFINDIAACVAEVQVHSISGNHSEIRPLGSNRGDFEEENMERIIFWYMEQRLSNEGNILFDETCDKMKLVDICGYNFLLLHGDNPKDIANISRDAINLYGEKIDYYLCGHLHKETEFSAGATPDGNAVIVRVPSLCGTDRYAQNKFFGGKAGATAMLMEEGYGRRCVYPISLQ